MAAAFRIVSAPVDPVGLKRVLEESAAGACVTFEGWVRNHNEGEAVQALEYEAHQSIAEKEGARIVAEALERFAITAAYCEHRVGKLGIGDCAVWVGVSAPHRGAAFDACRYIIDETKARVPIWKKEHYASGVTGWVNCATKGALSSERLEIGGRGVALPSRDERSDEEIIGYDEDGLPR